MKNISYRLMNFYAFLCVIVMFGVAFYLQFWKGIAPCPLCVLQRVTMALIGIVLLVGSVFALKKCGRYFLNAILLLLSSGGIFLAGRQVWLQHLPPDKSADCGVSLQYMWNVLPLDQVLMKILQGTAECSLVDWSFLGLSLAEWSLFWFIVFAVFSLWQIARGAK